MSTTSTVVSIVLALFVLASGVGTVAKVPAIVATITSVGYPADRIWVLGVLKILGGIGLLVGLWVAWIGIAAAVGITLYFVGALVFHLRAKNYQIGPALVALVLALVVLLRSASA